MTLSEAKTVWEARHSRLKRLTSLVQNPETSCLKKFKATAILLRWTPYHLGMAAMLAKASLPIPKHKGVFKRGGMAIVGDRAKEIIAVDDPSYAGAQATNKLFTVTLCKRLNK